MRRRWIALALAALLALAAAACAGQTPEEPGKPGLWFTADLSDWSAATDALERVDYDGPERVPDVMAALLAGPAADSGLTSAIPAGTRLLGWSLENGLLLLDLSQSYGALAGIDLTLADYCITLTMTQLEGVERVRITVNGSDVSYRGRQVLTPEDVVFSGIEEEPVEVRAALYFRRADTGELGFELRSFRLTGSELPARAVLLALLAGPEDEGLAPLLPEGLEAYSVRVDDGVCSADLSAALLDSLPEDPAEQALVIASIVETLCSLEAVQSVQLLIEGEAVPAYGEVDLTAPLRPEQ